MKKTSLFLISLVGFLIAHAQPLQKLQGNCVLGIELNSGFSRAGKLDSILERYAPSKLPGAAVAVYSEKEGWWAGSSGYASLEKKIKMDDCHLQYLQSVSKTYMAVEILQLKEKGRIHLDSPMTKYLPLRYSKYIKDAGKITVRMLLNQVSGVPEYNSNQAFVSKVMLHPQDYFTSEDCLKSIANEPLQFEPGSKYQYTNTNYLLLALIGDAITGDHAEWMKKNIFQPLGLRNTYYGKDHKYLDGLYLPETYWDVFNVGKPANISPLQEVTVASSKGDDGIVCTPADAVAFLKGLMEGKLLRPESMEEMLNFVKDAKGNKRYGMGISYLDLGGLPAYGHGGGGVGAGCGLIYIPSHKMYIFLATNLGVLVEGDLAKKADEMKTALLMALLQ